MAPKAMPPTILNVVEAQVAVDFDDPPYDYHWRGLLVRLDGSKWVCCSSTYEVETIDLKGHQVIPLSRNAPYPTDIVQVIFMPRGFSEATWDRVRLDGLALANPLGSAPVAPGAGGADWYFSDTATDRFGDAVSQELSRNPGCFEVRGSSF